MSMKWYWVLTISATALIIGGLGSWFIKDWYEQEYKVSLFTPAPTPTPKPLLKYTFENLAKRDYTGSEIHIGEILEDYQPDDKSYEAKWFYFYSDGKKVTGQINIPMTPEGKRMPVVIMLRGYVDREIYKTGMGTQKAAGFLAENGYVTLAPDFLGYGDSDLPNDDVWWDRFNNPVIVLNLLASLEKLDFVDTSQIGIWAHSNGGQIALSVLEITEREIPTILWAPVTKPFPYSILYFTDEFDDEGKALRKEVARLEKDYNVDDFSMTNYLEKIMAPIQLHQGTADDAVTKEWSDEFSDKMEELEKEVDYYVYNGADHNMSGGWDKAMERGLEFLEEELGE
jgi:uncharacterized protein